MVPEPADGGTARALLLSGGLLVIPCGCRYFLVVVVTSWWLPLLPGGCRYFLVVVVTSWWLPLLPGGCRYFLVVVVTSWWLSFIPREQSTTPHTTPQPTTGNRSTPNPQNRRLFSGSEESSHFCSFDGYKTVDSGWGLQTPAWAYRRRACDSA